MECLIMSQLKVTLIIFILKTTTFLHSPFVLPFLIGGIYASDPQTYINTILSIPTHMHHCFHTFPHIIIDLKDSVTREITNLKSTRTPIITENLNTSNKYHRAFEKYTTPSLHFSPTEIAEIIRNRPQLTTPSTITPDSRSLLHSFTIGGNNITFNTSLTNIPILVDYFIYIPEKIFPPEITAHTPRLFLHNDVLTHVEAVANRGKPLDESSIIQQLLHTHIHSGILITNEVDVPTIYTNFTLKPNFTDVHKPHWNFNDLRKIDNFPNMSLINNPPPGRAERLPLNSTPIIEEDIRPNRLVWDHLTNMPQTNSIRIKSDNLFQIPTNTNTQLYLKDTPPYTYRETPLTESEHSIDPIRCVRYDSIKRNSILRLDETDIEIETLTTQIAKIKTK